MMAFVNATVAKLRDEYKVPLMKIIVPSLLAMSIFHAPAAALAASSDWHRVQGGAIRLVTEDAPDADGILRGALEIKLNPGWKTYWIDPGSSGVPPTLDIEIGGQTVTTELEFPAPQRFDDGYTQWAGYDRSVALAVTLDLPETSSNPQNVEARAFLGLCETICIPVQASFSLKLDARTVLDDMRVVAAAFGDLPGPVRSGFEAVVKEAGADGIVVEAHVPSGVEALDFYLAGTDKLMLGTPVLVDGDTVTTFSVPIERRNKAVSGETLLYTLTTSAGAVTGHLTLP